MKRIIGIAVPVMLLFGCGVGDKDSTPKVEETSKAMLKTVISEKEYPYYICEQLVEFQYYKDNLIIVGLKKDKDSKEIFKAVDGMDEHLDRIENIKVPDKYKDIHKLVMEGVTDAREGTKIIKESKDKDLNEVSLAVMQSTPHMSGADGEQWREATFQITKETEDAYAKALEKSVEKHAKK